MCNDYVRMYQELLDHWEEFESKGVEIITIDIGHDLTNDSSAVRDYRLAQIC